MTRIAIVATGGTIACEATDAGVVATKTAAQLVERAGLDDIEIETVDLMTVGSYRLTLGHLRQISDAVGALLTRSTERVDGVVITHGTDTMEETAILLELVHDDPRPVVLTGAQRAGDNADGDGPGNLTDAVRVAATPTARDRGVMIVFAGQIIPARGARKIHTTALDAFRSVVSPSSGKVTNGQVCFGPTAPRPDPLPRPDAGFDDTRVDLVDVYPGADDALLRAAAACGAAGIVLAGTGIGNGNPAIVEAAADLVDDGLALVLSTRVPAGPVRGVYGNGGGADLVGAGVPPVSGLPATQARILLALLLSTGRTRDQPLAHLIETYADVSPNRASNSDVSTDIHTTLIHDNELPNTKED
ncbi:asparaginase [Gordonia sp. (in: high G+C Gram-positive bacteria)]|uniref:asparaginase n=1 Tax=Gordonia sp. (in: high G+C Gram-positive bacteria) TaxID=84139 RepID=UPI0035B1AA8C